MRIYISSDMEGATGVSDWWQTMNSRKEYEFGCAMENHDILAVIEGAFEAGADEILVNDSHGRKINLDIRSIPRGVRLLSGTPKPLGMMEGCDEGFDGVFFVGYHAMCGTPYAVLDHTISGSTVFSIRLNGREVGETGLNAAVASHFGLPVALVTGDDALEREVRNLLGDSVRYACVKRSHGRFACDSLSPADSHELLRKKSQEAVTALINGQIPPLPGQETFELEITFHNTNQCDAACQIASLERLGGRTVRLCGKGMDIMRRWCGAIISLAATANS